MPIGGGLDDSVAAAADAAADAGVAVADVAAAVDDGKLQQQPNWAMT